jgi:hypothetical protein
MARHTSTAHAHGVRRGARRVACWPGLWRHRGRPQGVPGASGGLLRPPHHRRLEARQALMVRQPGGGGGRHPPLGDRAPTAATGSGARARREDSAALRATWWAGTRTRGSPACRWAPPWRRLGTASATARGCCAAWIPCTGSASPPSDCSCSSPPPRAMTAMPGRRMTGSLPAPARTRARRWYRSVRPASTARRLSSPPPVRRCSWEAREGRGTHQHNQYVERDHAQAR